MDINLKLSVEETNAVLIQLSQGRFVDVNNLLMKIKMQADAQVAAANAPPTPAPAPSNTLTPAEKMG